MYYISRMSIFLGWQLVHKVILDEGEEVEEKEEEEKEEEEKM